jgi:ArsR family transcriptional regulator, arsenate/arsenite/antimonite-responsive transcriptional repressor
MSTRTRPEGCCTVPNVPPPIAESDRTHLVAVLKALGDATRLEIFRLIAAQDAPICVCDVVDRFDLRQPTISHHLKVLREAGLVVTSRQGIWAYYAVDEDGLTFLKDSLQHIAPEGAAALR